MKTAIKSITGNSELLVCHLLKDIDVELSESQIDEIVILTNGWNPSEIESLAREAVMRPLRDIQSTLLALKDANISYFVPPLRPVYSEDFLRAYERMLSTTQSDDSDGEEDESRGCGSRESRVEEVGGEVGEMKHGVKEKKDSESA